MNENDAPNSSPPDHSPQLVVVIVRTGGIAGIRRQWQVKPPLDETPQWVALIERCPWDAPDQELRGADRYVWSIRAQTPADRRERDVPDHDLAGPWRELVEAVRSADHSAEAADDSSAGTRE